jgi:hypothetical protein
VPDLPDPPDQPDMSYLPVSNLLKKLSGFH